VAVTVDLAEHVVLVTGGARGVGLGITHALLAAGATVVSCGRNEPEPPLPPGARHRACDVRDADQVRALIEGIAADLMRARRLIGAEGVAVFADVHVKHAAQLVDRPIRESALDAVERGGADVLVVSGARTGEPPEAEDLAQARAVANVVIGSGLTPENAGRLLGEADGAIVATALREGGDLRNPVEGRRVERLMEVVRGVRTS